MDYIKRNIKSEIVNHLPQREITLITGARQIGKTTPRSSQALALDVLFLKALP